MGGTGNLGRVLENKQVPRSDATQNMAAGLGHTQNNALRIDQDGMEKNTTPPGRASSLPCTRPHEKHPGWLRGFSRAREHTGPRAWPGGWSSPHPGCRSAAPPTQQRGRRHAAAACGTRASPPGYGALATEPWQQRRAVFVIRALHQGAHDKHQQKQPARSSFLIARRGVCTRLHFVDVVVEGVQQSVAWVQLQALLSAVTPNQHVRSAEQNKQDTLRRLPFIAAVNTLFGA